VIVLSHAYTMLLGHSAMRIEHGHHGRSAQLDHCQERLSPHAAWSCLIIQRI